MWQDVLGLIPIVIMILVFIIFIFQYYSYYYYQMENVQKEDLAISRVNYFILNNRNFELKENILSIGKKSNKFISFPVLYNNKIKEVKSYA